MDNTLRIAGFAVREAARHGLGSHIRDLHLDWHLPLAQRWFLSSKSGHHAQRVARAIETLGGSFAGFGRYASTRADLLGPDVAECLARIQNSFVPLHPTETRSIIESATGPVENVFTHLSKKPSGGTWNTQIHKGMLKDSTPVKVTVRPEEVSNDELGALRYLAFKVHNIVPRASDLVDGFEQDCARKHDVKRYAREVHAAVRSATRIQVAPVLWDLSSSSVLVEEDMSAWKLPGGASSVLMENALCKGLLFSGTTSNTRSGKILIEDAHLDVLGNKEKAVCKELWQAILRRNTGALTATLLKAGTATENTDVPQLHDRVAQSIHNSPLAALSAALEASWAAGLQLPHFIYAFARSARSE